MGCIFATCFFYMEHEDHFVDNSGESCWGQLPQTKLTNVSMLSVNLTAMITCTIDPCFIPYVYSVWCTISYRLLKGGLTSLTVSEATRLAVYDAKRTTHASIHVPATSLLGTVLAAWIVPRKQTATTHSITIRYIWIYLFLLQM